jgi:hypothetical protein
VDDVNSEPDFLVFDGMDEERAVPVIESGPTLAVEHTDTLSYAHAHNRVPVIHSVIISDVDRMARGASLSISLRDAHGPVGAPMVIAVDLEPGQETVLKRIDFKLDPEAMLQIEEQRPGRLVFELTDGDATLTTFASDVRLLAANQWLANPLALALELLAAFVMPNHPSIDALTAEAARILEARTGSDSMEGYQREPERVDAIVQAIFAAMQGRNLRYVLPPASWADNGQKVRNPGHVLDQGAGTCLDTTVVLAAALEHAGIRPLIWIVQGHSFLGYWRVERSLGSTAATDVGDIVNLIDLGAIGLIETTLTTSDEPVDFGAMQRDVIRTWLSGSFDRVQGVTDVYRARRDAILPLPVRRTLPDGQVVVTEYTPAAPGGTGPVPSPPHASVETERTRPMRPVPPPRVAHWKNALLDMSLRNRLINFTDHARFKLTVPSERVGRFEDEISSGKSFTMLPSDHIGEVQRSREIEGGHELPAEILVEFFDTRQCVFTDVSSATYLTRMRNLAYQARTLIEETGANNLYLAFGSLVWSLDGRALRSPLILIPVTVSPVSRHGLYRVSLDESGASTPNYCLLEKLRQTHGLEIPELEVPAEDGNGLDLEKVLLATRHAILDKGLGFRVEATADLAILQFAKFRLWKDLDEYWEAFESNSLVRHLIRTPFEPFVDPASDPVNVDLDELAARSPMPADSSQLAAVAEAVAGKTFVLEGPPGTGKSQTITNLLTRAIAEGKRVLFVAEKRAALDVVQRRLDEVGLGIFSLDLHDRHSKPNEVRRQVRSALEAVFEVDQQGFVDALSRHESARRRLELYPRRLHEKNAAGHSYYSARTQELTIDDEIPPLPVPDAWPGDATPEAIAQVRELLNTLADVADLARPADPHPWGFIDAKHARGLDSAAIHAAAVEFDARLNELPSEGAVAPVLQAVRQAEALTAFAALLSAPELDQLAILDEVRTASWQQRADQALRELTSFAELRLPVLSLVTPDALNLDLADIDRQAREAAASGFFGRKGRLKAVADLLAPVLQPGATIDPKHLADVTRPLAAVGATANALRRTIEDLPGLALVSGWNPLVPEHRTWVERRLLWLRWSAGLVDPETSGGRTHFVGALRELLESGATVDRAVAQAVSRAGVALQTLVSEAAVLPEDLLGWSGESGLIARWRETAAARRVQDSSASTLRAWLDLLHWLEPMREQGLYEARRALLRGEVIADDAVRSFARGLASASRQERAAATGIEPFDDRAHERRIQQFVDASTAIRSHLVSFIPQEVVASRSFDPRADAGRVGRLTRELSRQRGGMGVRTLLDTFGDLVTAIMPCVLVSPDSVARFFPARAGLFDIVVFDEASQIRVADAIGAMGRARSVVVVGDSKQMPPTSFAEPTNQIDELLDEDVAEDEESILTECVNAQVPRRWLSWHYRSQDEALIAFSNQQYYEQKLSSFPAPVHGNSDAGPQGHGISLVRVNGTFHRNRAEGPHRTNPVEARAIVDEIRRRFAHSPAEPPSIGVVTFNIQQRNLIESMLRDSGDSRLIDALEDPDGLFVKNLENVQGDERDSIFFSTAFSVNDRGVLPLNFGPLNRAGGERRLNVAITRARRQVVVFSSFDPDQLRAEETSSVGVKHLRAYLDIAANGTRELPSDGRKRPVIDRHREEIADALRMRGYSVRTDVGLSEFRIDLVVATADRPERPVMAILLDGEAWAARRTVGDRDGLPNDVLRRMLGWPAVERIWMPAWLVDRDAELAEIDRAFAAALDRLESTEPEIDISVVSDEIDGASPAALDPEDASGPLPEDQVDVDHTVGAEFQSERAIESHPDAPVEPELVLENQPAETDADMEDELEALRARFANFSSTTAVGEQRTAPPSAESLEEPLVAWTPRFLGGLEAFDSLSTARQRTVLGEVLREIIEIEGPVHHDRLIRAVGTGFGISRVVESRRRAILSAVPRDLQGERGEPFAWPSRLDRATWRGYRPASGGYHRPIDQINPLEIANAMAAIAHRSAGIEIEELKREALDYFGLKRMTTASEIVLSNALELGIQTGRLSISRDGIITRAD